MIHVEIQDKAMKSYLRKAPARANWAIKEAFGKAGGHWRKKLRDIITRGAFPLAPLSEVTTRGRERNFPPLGRLSQIVFFRVRKVKKTSQVLWLGYLPGVKGLGAKRWGKYTLTQMARLHEYGKQTRVTKRTRGRFARMGFPLKKETKMIIIPERPVLDLFWKKYNPAIIKYIEKSFFEIFLSKRNPRLGA